VRRAGAALTGAALSIAHAVLLGMATILLMGIGVRRERQLADGDARGGQSAPSACLVVVTAGSTMLAAIGTGWLLVR